MSDGAADTTSKCSLQKVVKAICLRLTGRVRNSGSRSGQAEGVLCRGHLLDKQPISRVLGQCSCSDNILFPQQCSEDDLKCDLFPHQNALCIVY